MKYIQEGQKDDCFFCESITQPEGVENLVVVRGKQVFAVLNLFPYTSGHLMVVPFNHVATLDKLDPEIRAELMEFTNQATCVLESVYHPDGFNLGINIGKSAGAGIVDHIHLHIVPRWEGDTNFMSSLAETRVLPESIEDTYHRVREAWENLY